MLSSTSLLVILLSPCLSMLISGIAVHSRKMLMLLSSHNLSKPLPDGDVQSAQTTLLCQWWWVRLSRWILHDYPAWSCGFPFCVNYIKHVTTLGAANLEISISFLGGAPLVTVVASPNPSLYVIACLDDAVLKYLNIGTLSIGEILLLKLLSIVIPCLKLWDWTCW